MKKISWMSSFLLLCSLFFCLPSYAENQGKFSLVFTPAKQEANQDVARVIKKSKQFQNIVAALNQDFILPENITIQFSEESNPGYQSTTKTIVMSYEYIFALSALYLERHPCAKPDDVINYAMQASMLFFYQEVTLALNDELSLPA